MPGWGDPWGGWFPDDGSWGEDPFPLGASVPEFDPGIGFGLDTLTDPTFGGGFADPFGGTSFNLFGEGGGSTFDQLAGSFGARELF